MAILVLHSFGGSTAHWKNQMQYLQTKTITMDPRGHGNSETPAKNDFAIGSQVKDVKAVVNSLGLALLGLKILQDSLPETRYIIYNKKLRNGI